MQAFLEYANGVHADQIIGWAVLVSLPLMGIFALRQILVAACDLYNELAEQRQQNTKEK